MPRGFPISRTGPRRKVGSRRSARGCCRRAALGFCVEEALTPGRSRGHDKETTGIWYRPGQPGGLKRRHDALSSRPGNYGPDLLGRWGGGDGDRDRAPLGQSTLPYHDPRLAHFTVALFPGPRAKRAATSLPQDQSRAAVTGGKVTNSRILPLIGVVANAPSCGRKTARTGCSGRMVG